ncbi:hypothetical protein VTK73DRAFT_8766 [Phialemonium thermophilum]|uniref:PA14 domain-containing protein n=1 Tax=Phialemonium thermophilum TaxID=223376 RepID=A0ABR3W680_9PEZI
MLSRALVSCFWALGLVASASCDPLDDACPDGVAVVELQPVVILQGGQVQTTTITSTHTLAPAAGASVPPDAVVEVVPGPDPGTTTIVPPPGCTSGCSTTVRVTVPPSVLPSGVVSVDVPGPAPGTTTVPPPPGCTTDCTTTIRVTTAPGIVTTQVPGPVPGTTTIPPPPGCVSDCTTSVIVTADPGATPTPTPTPLVPGIVTTEVTGPVAGTETIPPPLGCTVDCTATVRITRAAFYVTLNVAGPVAGTETIPPDPACTADCSTTVRITTVPNVEPTPTEVPVEPTPTPTPPAEEPTPTPTPEPTPTPPTVGPVNACAFPAGSCGSGGVSVFQFVNYRDPSVAYGVSDGVSGVGPDYYIGLNAQRAGSSPTLSVDFLDDGNASGDPEPANADSDPNFTYYPGLTKTYAGMTFDANLYTLVFMGLFFPPETGIYTFCLSADNRDVLYIGSDTAFSCTLPFYNAVPTGAPPLADMWFGRDNGEVCAEIALVGGYYYPLRQVFGNWGSPSGLDVTVQGPGIPEATSDFSQYLAMPFCGVMLG